MVLMNNFDKEFIDLVLGVLDGEVDFDYFQECKFTKIGFSESHDKELAEGIWHLVWHFFTDEDIRQDDPTYDKSARELIRSELNTLKGQLR